MNRAAATTSAAKMGAVSAGPGGSVRRKDGRTASATRRCRRPQLSGSPWRAAALAVALHLFAACMQLADAQDVAPKAGGRVSYEQPADQGGVLTRQDGPPYRDAGDAKVALLWVVIVTFALALFCVCYCICSHGNGSCKWCRETVEGPVAAVLCGSGCIVCTIIYFIWVFLS